MYKPLSRSLKWQKSGERGGGAARMQSRDITTPGTYTLLHLGDGLYKDTDSGLHIRGVPRDTGGMYICRVIERDGQCVPVSYRGV